MDEVQCMLQRLDGEMRATPAAEASAAVSEKRTRLVFLYSDEDEAREADAVPIAPGSVMAECTTSTALHVSDEELARMRLEAEQMVRPTGDVDGTPALPIRADTLSMFVQHTPAVSFTHSDGGAAEDEKTRPCSSIDEAGRGANGMRVCAVEADTLPTPPTAGSQYRARRERATRTYLLPSELDSTLPRLKRFREDDEEGCGEMPAEGMDVLRPAIVEAGVVRAVQSAGYRLTVNEADLLQETESAEADEVVGMADDETTKRGGDRGATPDASRSEMAECDAAGADDCLDEEDEDEEEEALDEMLVAAVVERLVTCCEAEDLDQAIAPTAQRFTSVAKPLLERLQANGMSLGEFGCQIDRDLRRFLRIYRTVYRPKDEPIVIDGVVMDM